ncbi:MAG: 16S rRNA (adenine(1518)-N(6)/adenine(1519)-N(6))-dimethyltransferase RsmA [Candidatus Thorarchaeota archaeon]
MSLLSEHSVRQTLLKYGVRPRRSIGQTFLVDECVARRVVEAACVSENDTVLEIGGGLGILTECLAQRARRVYVVEIDPRLVRALRDLQQRYPNMTVIHGDALEVNLPPVDKCVSNIPYHISSDLTFRILEIPLSCAVVMYQKEYGERLLAKPGTPDYSRLTIGVRYLMDVEKVFDVSRRQFYPVPLVDSVVVRMTPRSHGPFAKSREVFQETVRGLYAHPNKQLRRALVIWARDLALPETLPEEVLSLCGRFTGSERLRQLSLDDLVVIADAVQSLVGEDLQQIRHQGEMSDEGL